MNILGLIASALGIGGKFLENKAKLKELKQTQEQAILEAETKSIISKIQKDTDADNDIDLITARNKKYTYKDEVVTYLFLIPVIVATITPFLIAFDNGEWLNLNQYVKDSYESLDSLPTWYKYVLGAIIIDVLGFRSFARKLVDTWIAKKTKDKTK